MADNIMMSNWVRNMIRIRILYFRILPSVVNIIMQITQFEIALYIYTNFIVFKITTSSLPELVSLTS